MAATFHIRSFGCRANQAESEALAAQLARAGMERGDAARADWIVLHTCTVTAEADREARRAIRRLHRMRPEARIAVTGCYAERSPAELAGLEGVTVVAGHAAQWSLGEQLVSIERRGAPLGCA
ncbi:MAG: tRNA (N(6)-L-threonylcarbamoyladenosine(37)-C(2))-methylthiotransferase MtaB, partial [Terriglobales bacterium]